MPITSALNPTCLLQSALNPTCLIQVNDFPTHLYLGSGSPIFGKCWFFLPPIFNTVFWQPFWKWQTSRKFWKRRIAPLMVTYHYVKCYVSNVSIIIHLEDININVRNFNFPIGFYSNPHPFEPLKIWLWPLYHKAENFRTN